MREEMVNRIVEAIGAEIGEGCRVLTREVRKNNGLRAWAVCMPGCLYRRFTEQDCMRRNKRQAGGAGSYRYS